MSQFCSQLDIGLLGFVTQLMKDIMIQDAFIILLNCYFWIPDIGELLFFLIFTMQYDFVFYFFSTMIEYSIEILLKNSEHYTIALKWPIFVIQPKGWETDVHKQVDEVC